MLSMCPFAWTPYKLKGPGLDVSAIRVNYQQPIPMTLINLRLRYQHQPFTSWQDKFATIAFSCSIKSFTVGTYYSQLPPQSLRHLDIPQRNSAIRS